MSNRARAEELAARLESGWCPIESPADMERAAAELRRLSAERDALREALAAYAAEQAQAQEPVGEAHSMPGTGGFTMACFSAATVPVGTKLYDAPVEQSAKAVPALYVGLIERLMRLSTRLGIAYEGGGEHFAASLEDRLYAICRGAESLLNSVATPPAPEAQQAAGQEQDERAAFEAWAISYSTIPLKRDDDASLGFTGYTEMDQTMLWDAWQARAALAQRREPLTDQQRLAIREAERNVAADCYFHARAWILDTKQNRRLFEAGFDAGIGGIGGEGEA